MHDESKPTHFFGVRLREVRLIYFNPYSIGDFTGVAPSKGHIMTWNPT